MKRIFENLINGNLKTAKNQAKRYSLVKLARFAIDEMLWGKRHAEAAAFYIKGKITFQEYCEVYRAGDKE